MIEFYEVVIEGGSIDSPDLRYDVPVFGSLDVWRDGAYRIMKSLRDELADDDGRYKRARLVDMDFHRKVTSKGERVVDRFRLWGAEASFPDEQAYRSAKLPIMGFMRANNPLVLAVITDQPEYEIWGSSGWRVLMLSGGSLHEIHREKVKRPEDREKAYAACRKFAAEYRQ